MGGGGRYRLQNFKKKFSNIFYFKKKFSFYITIKTENWQNNQIKINLRILSFIYILLMHLIIYWLLNIGKFTVEKRMDSIFVCYTVFNSLKGFRK